MSFAVFNRLWGNWTDRGWLRVVRVKAFVEHNYVIIHRGGQHSGEFKGYSELPTCVLKIVLDLVISKYVSNTFTE